MRWLSNLAEVTGGHKGALTGCIVSNELVDALPVHVVEARDGRLFEVYVALTEDDNRLAEQLGGDKDSAA